MNNACTELERAIMILATSPLPLQQRLAKAWVKVMSFNLSNGHDTSESITTAIHSLEQRILSKGGDLNEAAAKLNDEECTSIITQIVSLYRHALSEKN